MRKYELKFQADFAKIRNQISSRFLKLSKIRNIILTKFCKTSKIQKCNRILSIEKRHGFRANFAENRNRILSQVENSKTRFKAPVSTFKIGFLAVFVTFWNWISSKFWHHFLHLFLQIRFWISDTNFCKSSKFEILNFGHYNLQNFLEIRGSEFWTTNSTKFLEIRFWIFDIFRNLLKVGVNVEVFARKFGF